MKPEAWEDYKRRSRKWHTRIDYELLHSEAYKSIQYAPTLKVLNWAFEKRKARRTNSRKNRYVEIDEPFSFTYEEAKRRGLTNKQFNRAVRELISLGFWDLEKQGSGLQGDCSLYRLSDRWRSYGQKDFESRELPKRVAWGCFGFPKKIQKQRDKSAVAQRSISAVENDFQ